MTIGRGKQAGSSLVEVVLALGLMAGVLTSVAGLFVIGAGQVRSGRTATEALAAARTVLEEMDGWSFHQSYGSYGFDGSAAAYSADTRTNSYASKWQSDIVDRLYNGYATINIISLDPGAPALASSSQLQVMVTVFWEEGPRQRSIVLGMVRM